MPKTGQRLSHYQLLEKLGEGGMGEVYLAKDTVLDRQVALKLLARNLEEDVTARKRFLREAKSAAALDHPYICKIYEIGESDGRPYIAMEYVGGETLTDRLKGEPLPLADVKRIASEIAEALETAHREGIVHRDLKPTNIMLTIGGHVKVLDFGLAKRMTSPSGTESQLKTASQLTGMGATLGTMAYMSPEQLRGESVDARSDIFSFGIVLYELLTGVHPFSKGTAMDTAASILNQQPAPTTRYRKDLPEVLEHVVGKMLAKEPGERYQLVHEVRTDLERLDARSRGIDRPSPALSIPRLGTREVKVGAAVIVAVAVLGALWFRWEAPSPPPPSREGPPSVAVLPLTNISDDLAESDYLAEGISRSVITKLAQAGIRVTPWETARRYGHSNQSPDHIARELNVDSVLTGTFEFVGDRMVTTLSLVEAQSGLLTWAQEFEEPFEDIFRMQRRIAMGAATSLKKVLTGEEEKVLAAPESQSVDAYDFYLQGSHLLQEDDQESNEVAAEYFARALELDPDLAEAHVGLGAVHWLRYWAGTGEVESLDQAEASFDAALELDPASLRARRGLVEVHFLRGHSEACLIQGREAARLGRQNDVETLLARGEAYWSGGLGERSRPLLRRVMELDPVNQAAYHLFVTASWADEPQHTADVYDAYVRRFGESGFLQPWVGTAHYFLGNYDEARELYSKALTAEGDDPPWAHFFAGLFFDEMGERERAEEVWYRGIEVTKRTLDDYPDHVGMRLFLASFLGLVGERDSFLVEEERALEIADVNPFELPALAAVHAKLGESERAVELLRRSLRSGRIDKLALAALEIAGVRLDSPPYDQFLKEYEAEVQRLGELY